MTVEDAISVDCNGEMSRAADLYETLLDQEPALDIYLNLAVLYWQATDFGTSTALNLSVAFVARASSRITILLKDATLRFPNRTEPEFWVRYIGWADYGTEFPVDECRSLVAKDPNNLIPYLYLVTQSNNDLYREQGKRLLELCRTPRTTKNLYVVSVLESALAFWS